MLATWHWSFSILGSLHSCQLHEVVPCMSISLPLASIILFVDFGIPIVMRPSMSFIKGLVIGARIQCYDVIEPLPIGTINFIIFILFKKIENFTKFSRYISPEM